jgi:flagellar basal body-associated protein FliL
MADKAEKKSEAPAKDSHDKKGEGDKKAAAAAGGLMTKMPVLLGGVMLIEAIVLFAGFKFLGASARPAQGAEVVGLDPAKGDKDAKGADGAAAPDSSKKTAELQVVDFRAPNRQSGRLFVYDVSIFAVVKAEDADRIKQMITDKEALIKDRVRTIIAQADPDKLGGGSEPGLETLRRQIKYQLDEIVGDGLVDEVLVPRCMPFRADY